MEGCRQCTISVAIGFALDVCEQENIKVPKLVKINAEGYESEDEVFEALKEFNDKVPSSRRVEANSIKCFVFDNIKECKLV